MGNWHFDGKGWLGMVMRRGMSLFRDIPEDLRLVGPLPLPLVPMTVSSRLHHVV